MRTSDAAALARRLMIDNGLGRVAFEFGRGKNQNGSCLFDRRTGAVLKIKLSEHFVRLNSEDRVKITVLHEIAHALAGHAAGHGPLWQREARRLGIPAVRCSASVVETNFVPKSIHAVCPTCPAAGVLAKYHRMPKPKRHKACGTLVKFLRVA